MNDTPSAGFVRPNRRELFLGFFLTGLNGFGGVMPHARRMLVDRQRWLSDRDFTDLLGLGQILPGPNVCNLAVIVGDRFHGRQGALIAIAGLMLAPLAIVILLFSLFAHYASAQPLQYAVAAVAAGGAGLMLSTGVRLAIKAERHLWSALIALLSLVAIWLRVPLLLVLAVLGPISIGLGWLTVRKELRK
ncbi:chromate transporter [Uliginosibacterium sediminicola]|uniref:Chromate transporter n=1 Tax=Uliginosibacterium sediminicola TaxID=2024550 RepID=A0ABU9Z3L2_9RHOO